MQARVDRNFICKSIEILMQLANRNKESVGM